MNKILSMILVIAIVVGGGAFYAGMKYGEGKSSGTNSSVGGVSAFGGQNFQGLTPAERQQRIQQMGDAGLGQRNGSRQGGGFSGGEIIAKDDKSITVKIREGGSKIVFISSSTPILKSTNGSMDDLKISEQVTVSGSANQDGSLTAQSIQIRQNAQ